MVIKKLQFEICITKVKSIKKRKSSIEYQIKKIEKKRWKGKNLIWDKLIEQVLRIEKRHSV